MNLLLLYRYNRIDTCASVGTHGNPKGKERNIIGIAISLVGGCMHLSAIKG